MLKRLIFTLAGITALLVGVWLALPWLLTNSARYIAAGNGFELRSFDLDRLGWHASLLRQVELGANTAIGAVNAHLQNLSLEYDPLALKLSSARARHVALRVDLTTGDAATTATGDTKALTLPLIEIDDLDLEIVTTTGTVGYRGSIRFDPGRPNSALTLRDEFATIELDYRADRRQLELRLTAIDGARPFVQGRFILNEDNHVMFTGEASLRDGLKWLQDSMLIPQGLREQFSDMSIEDGNLQGKGMYGAAHWQGELALAWQGLDSFDHRIDGLVEAKLAGQADGLNVEVTQISRLALVPKADNSAALIKRAAFVFEPGYRASVTVVDGEITQLEGGGPGEMRLEAQDELTVSGDRPVWQVSANLDRFSLGLLQATLEPQGMRAASFQTNAERTAVDSWQGRATVTGVQLPLSTPLPAADLDASWRVRPDETSADGKLIINSEPIAGWQLRRTAAQTVFGSRFEMSPKFVARSLAPYLGTNKDGVTLSGGTFTGQITGAWRQEPKLSADFKARDVVGKYSEIDFENLEVDVRIDDVFDPRPEFEVRGSRATLASGIVLSELRAAGGSQGKVIRVNDARLNTLGGRLRLSPTRFNIDDDTHGVEINLEGIDLTRLLDVLEQESLDGEGTLEGSLPIFTGRRGFTIKNGVLFNTRPGTLRYKTADGEAVPQLNNVALQALRDFRYKTLNGTINYAEDGNYSIKIRLEGNNPDLFDGYPIAFNINLNGLLDNVGRAMLFGGQLGTEILDRSRRPQQ